MGDRKPARDNYDALVDFVPERDVPDRVFCVVKYVIDLSRPSLTLLAAEPLLHDLRDKAIVQTFPRGSDFAIGKPGTDVVVQGSAMALEKKPVERHLVELAVGKAIKRVAVIGDRVVTFSGGRPSFSAPERFEEVPMHWGNAYGGCDPRVPMTSMQEMAFLEGVTEDMPGDYPRNEFGKGYLVYPEAPDFEVLLPNLEDPDDLLTPQRLIAGSPENWWKQPLPWCFDWTFQFAFPRSRYLDLFDEFFPAPLDERLPEVKRGYLLPNLPQQLERNTELYRLFAQEASHGLAMSELEPETPLRISGASADAPDLKLKLPARPDIAFTLDGRKTKTVGQLMSVVLRPNEKKATLTYSATMEVTGRKFIPGAFQDIPLSVSINGDKPIVYETPTPVREEIARGREAAGAP